MTNFIGVTAKKAKPTKKHRPALWECMLGTVYAMDPSGCIKYFDYDWDAAKAWVGLDVAAADPRVSRKTENVRYGDGKSDPEPRMGQLVLWVKE